VVAVAVWVLQVVAEEAVVLQLVVAELLDVVVVAVLLDVVVAVVL
jgi:hypothetical protein